MMWTYMIELIAKKANASRTCVQLILGAGAAPASGWRPLSMSPEKRRRRASFTGQTTLEHKKKKNSYMCTYMRNVFNGTLVE